MTSEERDARLAELYDQLYNCEQSEDSLDYTQWEDAQTISRIKRSIRARIAKLERENK